MSGVHWIQFFWHNRTFCKSLLFELINIHPINITFIFPENVSILRLYHRTPDSGHCQQLSRKLRTFDKRFICCLKILKSTCELFTFSYFYSRNYFCKKGENIKWSISPSGKRLFRLHEHRKINTFIYKGYRG